jgi:hypothetical protein
LQPFIDGIFDVTYVPSNLAPLADPVQATQELKNFGDIPYEAECDAMAAVMVIVDTRASDSGVQDQHVNSTAWGVECPNVLVTLRHFDLPVDRVCDVSGLVEQCFHFPISGPNLLQW